jgi:hypothetical protein
VQFVEPVRFHSMHRTDESAAGCSSGRDEALCGCDG